MNKKSLYRRRFWVLSLLLLAVVSYSVIRRLPGKAPAETLIVVDPSTEVADLLDGRDYTMIRNLANSIEDLPRRSAGKRYAAFAPSTGAFRKIPYALLSEIWVPKEPVWDKVFWHLLAKEYHGLEAFERGEVITQMSGETVKLSHQGRWYYVNEIPIRRIDILGSGAVYTIDTLLIPKSVQKVFDAAQARSGS